MIEWKRRLTMCLLLCICLGAGCEDDDPSEEGLREASDAALPSEDGGDVETSQSCTPDSPETCKDGGSDGGEPVDVSEPSPAPCEDVLLGEGCGVPGGACSECGLSGAAPVEWSIEPPDESPLPPVLWRVQTAYNHRDGELLFRETVGEGDEMRGRLIVRKLDGTTRIEADINEVFSGIAQEPTGWRDNFGTLLWRGDRYVMLVGRSFFTLSEDLELLDGPIEAFPSVPQDKKIFIRSFQGEPGLMTVGGALYALVKVRELEGPFVTPGADEVYLQAYNDDLTTRGPLIRITEDNAMDDPMGLVHISEGKIGVLYMRGAAGVERDGEIIGDGQPRRPYLVIVEDGEVKNRTQVIDDISIWLGDVQTYTQIASDGADIYICWVPDDLYVACRTFGPDGEPTSAEWKALDLPVYTSSFGDTVRKVGPVRLSSNHQCGPMVTYSGFLVDGRLSFLGAHLQREESSQIVELSERLRGATFALPFSFSHSAVYRLSESRWLSVTQGNPSVRDGDPAGWFQEIGCD